MTVTPIAPPASRMRSRRLRAPAKARSAPKLTRVGALVLCLTLSGALPLAAATSQRSKPAASAGHSLVWPPPPAAPRVAYVQSIAKPADLGVKRSFFGSVARLVIGSETSHERLVKPFGIALDEGDNVCLTDSAASVVCHLDRTRKKWARWERVGTLRLIAPVAIAKHQGRFFVADTGLGAVVVFNDQGELLSQITNRLERPAGLVVAGERLLVVDSQRHRVVVYDLAAQYRSEFGQRGSGPGEFNFPTHITADRHGDLYVTDSMNGRIVRFDREGRFKNQIGALGNGAGHFGRPKGVAVDTFGHVYVIDALLDSIEIFDPEGRFLMSLGSTGAEPGQFWLPNGIAISGQNEIFVADAYNRRVQVFRYVGGSTPPGQTSERQQYTP